MSARGEYPELLQDLLEQLSSSLQGEGLEPKQATRVARKATEAVRKHWGGSHLYIPKGDMYEIEARDLEIYRKFTGRNYIELAREYDLCEARVRIIVKAVRKAERDRRQLSMFR